MKRLLPLSFTLLISTYATTVNAENSWYLGALYNAQEISITGRDFNTAGLMAGYTYNQYFAVEARFASGTSSYQFSSLGTSYSSGSSGYSGHYGTGDEPWGSYSEDIDTQISLSIKASYPIFKSVKLYALSGYTNTKLEIKGLGQYNDTDGNITGNYSYTHTEYENGFSYGVGVDYQINENVNVFIDYQVLPNFEPNSSVSKSWKSGTIGISYSF